jgi:hypothetical protein
MITYQVDARQKDRPAALYVRSWDGYERPNYTRLFDLESPYDEESCWRNLEWAPYANYGQRNPDFSRELYREIEVSLAPKQLKEFFLHLITVNTHINYVELLNWNKESKTWNLLAYIHPESYKEFW